MSRAGRVRARERFGRGRGAPGSQSGTAAHERAAFSHARARCRAPCRRVARSPTARVVHPSVARQLELERAVPPRLAGLIMPRAAGHVHWGREAATTEQGPSALHLKWWRAKLFRRQQPGVPARVGHAKHESLPRNGHEMGYGSECARTRWVCGGDNRFISPSLEPCEVEEEERRASISNAAPSEDPPCRRGRPSWRSKSPGNRQQMKGGNADTLLIC